MGFSLNMRLKTVQFGKEEDLALCHRRPRENTGSSLCRKGCSSTLIVCVTTMKCGAEDFRHQKNKEKAEHEHERGWYNAKS